MRQRVRALKARVFRAALIFELLLSTRTGQLCLIGVSHHSSEFTCLCQCAPPLPLLPDSYLVEHGARLDLVNCDGELALDLAYQFAREGDASEPESEASDDDLDADAGAARRARRASRTSSKSSGTLTSTSTSA